MSIREGEFYIILLVLAVVLIGVMLLCGYGTTKVEEPVAEGNYYALTTKVVAIDQEADIVTCEDCNGNLWKFYGVEDWEVGDCASLLMESHGTKKIEDDTIEDVRFSAWELTR